MPLATGTLTIPHVKIDVQDPRGTNRPVFAPIYEAPLIERVFEGRAEIKVSDIRDPGPGGRPWPKDMRERSATFAEEESRLRNKYGVHPTTKQPLFEQVYGFGLFHEAFDRAVSGKWTAREHNRGGNPAQHQARATHPAMAAAAQQDAVDAVQDQIDNDEVPPEEAAPPAWAQLTRVKGLGDELAQALYEDGIEAVDEVAAMGLDELERYPGVGKRSGQKILDSANELVMADFGKADED